MVRASSVATAGSRRSLMQVVALGNRRDRHPAGDQHAAALVDRPAIVADVLQRVAHDHRVEHAVAEGQAGDVLAHVAVGGQPVRADVLPRPRTEDQAEAVFGRDVQDARALDPGPPADGMVLQRRRDEPVADLRSALRAEYEAVKVAQKPATAPAADVAAVTAGPGEQHIAIEVISRQTNEPAVPYGREHARGRFDRMLTRRFSGIIRTLSLEHQDRRSQESLWPRRASS